MKTQRNIKKTLKALRAIIDNKNTNEATKRMAYFAETTLRWAVEDTVGWTRPEVDLAEEVEFLKKEMGIKS